MPGLFISFEGIDGVGKSTQADALEGFVRSTGLDVVRSFEPGGTELGQEIRHLLLHRKGDVAPRAEALLYAADRAHHIATKIRPALEAGKVVIQDRYLDSSVAYQGAGRELDPEEIRNLSLWATGGLLPDLTILLDLDPAAARDRRDQTGNEPDRLEREKLKFFSAVRQEYLRLAANEPERFLVLDATTTKEALAEQIQARVAKLIK